MSPAARTDLLHLHVEQRDQLARLRGPAVAFALATVGLRLYGLPPVDLHSPLHAIGIMDPLCGGTRAALALGRGNLALAWRYNPLVPLLTLGVGALSVRWCFGYATGRWITVEVPNRRVLVLVGGVLLLALWLNQQANAELLMSGPRPRLGLWTR